MTMVVVELAIPCAVSVMGWCEILAGGQRLAFPSEVAYISAGDLVR
ncbi:hypothetical protein Tco_1007283, partial [Tanacetum coccineum]